MRFHRGDLRADLDQLVGVLVDTHPDAYAGFGGQVGFWRAVEETRAALPPDGLTGAEFLALLRPLVAGVRDGHTLVLPAGRRPGEVPAECHGIEFDVVDRSLRVAAVYAPEHRPLLGGALVAVDGVPAGELAARTRRLLGYDNEYGNLVNLAHALREPALAAALTGAPGPMRVTVDRGGTVVLAPRRLDAAGRITPPSTLDLPDPGEHGIAWRMLDDVGYLRLGALLSYREVFEYARAAGITWLLDDRLTDALRRLGPDACGSTVDGRIAAVPAACDTVGDLLAAMAAAGSERLVVDVRHCPGGNGVVADILAWLLYGFDALLDTDEGYQIPRYSALYAATRSSGERPGYDFAAERAWRRGRADPGSRRERRRADLTELSGMLPSFAHHLATRAGAPIRPAVAVVTDAFTYSAGFDVAVTLRRHGAILVGTPSAQAPTCFIDTLPYRLDRTGLHGTVSYKYSVAFPDDAGPGRVLASDVDRGPGDDPDTPVHQALAYLRGGAGTSTGPGASGSATGTGGEHAGCGEHTGDRRTGGK